MTNHPLTFEPSSCCLSGPRGSVVLDPGPAALVARMMRDSGKLVPRAELAAALDLPASVGMETEAVLRGHLKTARVLAAALTGGSWRLRTQGQEAAGLIGPGRGGARR